MAPVTVVDVDIRRKAYPGSGRAAAHVALGKVAFRLRQSEIVCLFGPSGCGKTTILNMIAGLVGDFDGSIRFAPGARERLTYMFQLPRLLPWRTVYQNVDLARAASGSPRELSRRLIGEVGLEKFADAFPDSLSVGMQRRAALARAFACEPELLLMDEPFASLDEQTAGQLRTLLTDIWQHHRTTILFVTHDSREAVQLADRVLVFSPAPGTIEREVVVPLGRTERSDAEKLEAIGRSALAPR